jgi:hypothetical protein
VQGTADPEIREKFKAAFDIWIKNITEVLKQEPHFEADKSGQNGMLPYLIVSIMMGASMQYLMDEGKFDLNDYFAAAEKMVVNFLRCNK